MKAALYARVSTLDQEADNQLCELRRYADARGWTAEEYVDRGVSGARDNRPALDRLLRDARARRIDVLGRAGDWRPRSSRSNGGRWTSRQARCGSMRG